MKWWIALAGATAVLGEVIPAHRGSLKVSRMIPNDVGEVNRSWWHTASESTGVDGKVYDAEWKSRKLALSNAMVDLMYVGDDKIVQTIHPNDEGAFETPELDTEKQVMIRISHPAYVFPSILMDGERLFMVEPEQGVRRQLRRMKSLQFIPAARIVSPFPNPRTYSVWTLIKNPLVLMGGAMLLVTYGLPALTGGMDLKQLREEAGLGTSEAKFHGSFIPHLKNTQS